MAVLLLLFGGALREQLRKDLLMRWTAGLEK
jgi:hypothetical protein